MTAVAPDLDTIAHLDFEPPCGMHRCRHAPNPATHVMKVQMTDCRCSASYLICAPCIEHFERVMAPVSVCCWTHPSSHYRWCEVVTFTPIKPRGETA